MMRYLTFILPLLIKAPRKNPVQVLSGFAAMGLLIGLGALAVLIGIWFFLGSRFGVDVAWLAVGALMLLGALILFFGLKEPVKEREVLPHNLETDPLAELIPSELTNDPIVANILKQINEHPMGSMAAAVAVGTLFGQQLFASDTKQLFVKER